MRCQHVYFILMMALVSSLIACQSSKKIAPSPAVIATVMKAPLDKSDPNLDEAYAVFRADILHKVTYDLKIDATEPDEFSGTVAIGFDLNQSLEKPLLLDYRSGGTVESILINESKVSEIKYADGKIALPEELLQEGHNIVRVAFRRGYSSDGNGLYRFVDPEDQRVYVWTQFEAYFANSMFPCFDQPDLKAVFNFEATVPDTWQVVSTTRETSIELAANKKYRVWKFKPSPLISTYLFSFFGGPYFHWDSEAKSDLGRIPLRLFVRQSLKKYVHPEDWLSVTRAGFDYYGHLFNYPYPFGKYDQLIVPDFNDGGMENVASIALAEEYISRGRTSRNDREKIADLVLHEMAHMWFGDLVTMKWWNGLWLNESFASYMSSKASVEATEFKEAWFSFHDEMKRWAYYEDQLVTTHPIDNDVPDTKTAESAFDGITYGKGAASLQQLSALIGEEAFREGIRSYFKSHDFQNAKLVDFVSELGRASHKDLISWARGWLMSFGVDKVRAEVECDASQIKKIRLILTSPEGDTQERAHKIKLGLFSLNSGVVKLTSALDVELNTGNLESEAALNSMVGKRCPAFALANIDDRDYVKLELDNSALRFVVQNINGFSDPLIRMMLWDRLFEMVREAELSPEEYLKIAVSSIEREPDLHVALTISRTLAVDGREGSALYYLSRRGGLFSHYASALENAFWRKLLAANSASDWRGVYLDGFLASAYTPKAQKKLREILKGHYALKAPLVDQDRRWQMLIRLMGLSDPQNSGELVKMLDAEAKVDPSERGRQLALAAKAAAPNVQVKFKILNELSKDDESSAARKDAVLRNILPPWQDSFRASFAESFFEAVTHLTATDDQEFTERYGRYLMPAICEPLSSATIQTYLQGHRASLAPTVLKTFRVSLQEDRRCVKVRLQSDKEH